MSQIITIWCQPIPLFRPEYTTRGQYTSVIHSLCFGRNRNWNVFRSLLRFGGSNGCKHWSKTGHRFILFNLGTIWSILDGSETPVQFTNTQTNIGLHRCLCHRLTNDLYQIRIKSVPNGTNLIVLSITLQLTFRKIAIWMSKNCQKIVVFSKNFLFWHLIGNFQEGQLFSTTYSLIL